MDNNKGGQKQGKEVGKVGMVGRGGGKGRKLYLNNNKKMLKTNKKRLYFFPYTNYYTGGSENK